MEDLHKSDIYTGLCQKFGDNLFSWAIFDFHWLNTPPSWAGDISFVQQKKKETVLTLMEWPAQSPNLNPIKLLWEELEQ